MRIMRRHNYGKRGFTLVEVIVSMVILSLTVIGFTLMMTGNARAIAKSLRLDQKGYIDISMIENEQGNKTSNQLVLQFSDSSDSLEGEMTLYEYEVLSHEKYEKNIMYYFRPE